MDFRRQVEKDRQWISRLKQEELIYASCNLGRPKFEITIYPIGKNKY